MQIDRSNYEIWIIDWLDGKLNSSQVAQLNLFLDQNQDLKEEFNDLPHPILLLPDISFQNKEKLKKSPSEITQAQFEYLCAAYLENDLTISQKEEIDEIVKKSADRKKTFDQIQKTIIVPERVSFKHKNLLLKRPPYKKVILLSVKGIGIAAAISLIIVLYSVIPSTISPKINKTAQSLVSDSVLQKSPSGTSATRQETDINAVPAVKKRESSSAGINKTDNIITHQGTTIAQSVDPLIKSTDNLEIPVEKVRVQSPVDLGHRMISNNLIQFTPKSDLASKGDDKKHPVRLISKTFREKFLKEKTPTDAPLKGYEIAEAGISGLNKLLGWQMALDMKKDENGQTQSVSFSSGILKIQAPVKKREAQP